MSTSATSDAPYVLDFAALAARPGALAQVGGKGANLGILAGAGFPVPPGACLTTAGFRAFMAGAAAAQGQTVERLYAELEVPGGGAAMRDFLCAQPIPEAVAAATLAAWRALGEDHGYAVRSSATAEDLPGASFAGQQDTYLNIIGEAALLEAVRKCWASLFTDRAIAYRRAAGFSHRAVELSVLIQRMVLPQAAGVLFTADPISGRRRRIVIDASFGLGEALVSGQVNPDHYEVDHGADGRDAITRRVADKAVAIIPRADGGTDRVDLDAARRHAPVLDDPQILALAELGRRIEDHFAEPQDIEWCFADGELFVVQSRPITTLFPLPAIEETAEKAGLRVYLSFGHAQVMTDAMPPFALDVWRRVFPFSRDAEGQSQAMRAAGGRLFVDPSDLLRLPALAARVPRLLSLADREISAAVASVAQREAFERGPRRFSLPGLIIHSAPFAARMLSKTIWRVCFADTATIGPWTRHALDRQLAALDQALAALPSPRERLAKMDAVVRRILPEVALLAMPSVAGGMLSGRALAKLVAGRADPEQLAALDRGLPGNVTTQMDLAIGDLAELVRATPALADAIRTNERPSLEALTAHPDAGPLLTALETFLAEFGGRGASEIDISRPRWRDDPSLLLQVIRGNLMAPNPAGAREYHEALCRSGDAAVDAVADAARWWQRPLVRRLARAHRALFALREHPKFQLIRTFDRMRLAALAYGDELVAAGSLDRRDDVWLLHIAELLAAKPGEDLRALIERRRAAFDHHRRLSPPRVMTSEGEIVRAVIGDDQDLPEGALRGLGVSAGVVEGVARVVLNPTTTTIHAGEILVAPFTDPGWTPLFINAAGLVMEVGGMMTHGSVVAREYGIPAVVSVDGATTSIQTGERLRVDGSRGVVERLAAPTPVDAG